jgi:Zn-dependent protease
MGVVGAIGFFLSVIFHEIFHSLVARRFGIPMKGITLFVFGGVSEMSEEPTSAKAEFLMANVGPLSSIAIALACYGMEVAQSLGIQGIHHRDYDSTRAALVSLGLALKT